MPLNVARARGLVASPVFILLASEVVAKAAMFLLSIPIARLYDPAAMGLFGLYSSIITIISIPAALSIARAIPLPRSEGKAFVLMLLAVSLIVFTALLTLGFFSLAPVSVLSRMGLDGLRPIAWILPVAVLGWAGLPLVQMWLARKERFVLLAVSKLTQVSLQGGGQIALGVAHLGGLGLTLADALSRTLILTPFILSMVRPVRKWLRKPGRLLRMSSKILVEYRRFPLVVTPTLLLHSIPAALMPIAISSNLGIEAAGYWALAAYVTNAIFGISVSFTPYLYGLWSKSFHTNRGLSPSLVFRSSAPLIAIGVVVGLVLGLMGPPLFSMVFGSQWSTSGELAQALAIGLIFQIIAGPLILVLSVVNRESWNVSLAVVWCVLAGAAFHVIGAWGLNLLQTTWLYVGITCAIYAAYAATAFMAAQRSLTQ